MKTLLAFASNKNSQNGEDGILAELLKRLSITNGWFVEFGAWDGKNMSNTYALAEQGWNGVYIEGMKEKFDVLITNTKNLPGNTICINSWVTASGNSSLDNLLSTTQLPQRFEMLSIDIDSDDFSVWQSLENYNPIIVIIEINSSFPLKIKRTHTTGALRSGASFSAMLELGISKGYTLVCHTGNMIFVRNDRIKELHLPEDELKNPESLFVDTWIKSWPRQFPFYLWRWLKAKL